MQPRDVLGVFLLVVGILLAGGSFHFYVESNASRPDPAVQAFSLAMAQAASGQKVDIKPQDKPESSAWFFAATALLGVVLAGVGFQCLCPGALVANATQKPSPTRSTGRTSLAEHGQP